MYHKNIYLLMMLAWLLAMLSCKKENTPPNPYDDIATNSGSGSGTEPSPTSIQGLHKNIFSVKCANPGCHDGSFEPDFRTIESSYATLVYQSTIKTTVDSIHFFSKRVVPGSLSASFLYDRITTTTTEYMPSNGVRLGASDISNIATWIAEGAKDQLGNSPTLPNSSPDIHWFFALDSALNKIDSIKLNNINSNPFLIDPNQTIIIGFWVSDDSTSRSQLQDCKIGFSKFRDDFSNASFVNCTYSSSTGSWNALVSTLNFQQGEQIYFKCYANDGDHTLPSELPRIDSPYWLKSIFSFYVQ